jgi:hypothetical protein
MGEEFQPDWQWCRTVEQITSLLGRQAGDGFEVKRNRLLEGSENLLERAALDRDVEIEADRLPLAVATFGIAAQTSVRQL